MAGDGDYLRGATSINHQVALRVNFKMYSRSAKGGEKGDPNRNPWLAKMSNHRLVILNDDGTLDKEIPCSLGFPCDVTYLDDRTVAVSTYSGIEIINIDTKKTERRINTDQWCSGITYQNGVLLWCERQRGIVMMKLSDDRITTLVKQSKVHSDCYITTYNKIYQTNPNTNTVTCYTIKGDKLWEYKDESLLKDPHGVTVDNDGRLD